MKYHSKNIYINTIIICIYYCCCRKLNILMHHLCSSSLHLLLWVPFHFFRCALSPAVYLIFMLFFCLWFYILASDLCIYSVIMHFMKSMFSWDQVFLLSYILFILDYFCLLISLYFVIFLGVIILSETPVCFIIYLFYLIK